MRTQPKWRNGRPKDTRMAWTIKKIISRRLALQLVTQWDLQLALIFAFGLREDFGSFQDDLEVDLKFVGWLGSFWIKLESKYYYLDLTLLTWLSWSFN